MKTGNEIIAEFMGWTPETHRKYTLFGPKIEYWFPPSRGIGVAPKAMRWKTWNWIQPVCKKVKEEIIERFDSKYMMARDARWIRLKMTFVTTPVLLDIEKTYTIIVELINWYNENEKQPDILPTKNLRGSEWGTAPSW